MKGSIWAVIVFGVFGGLLLPVVNLGQTGSGQTSTNIAELFAWMPTVVGTMFVVVAAAAFLNWFSGGGF